jgi:hypothetical protein
MNRLHAKQWSHRDIVFELLGWYGSLALIAGFALNSFGVISAHSYAYQLINLSGALGIVAISLYKKVYQTASLNVFWVVIALVAIVNLSMGGQ